MTPAEAAEFVERFAARYVAERETREYEDIDAVKAQGWVLLVCAAALRKQPDSAGAERGQG